MLEHPAGLFAHLVISAGIRPSSRQAAGAESVVMPRHPSASLLPEPGLPCLHTETDSRGSIFLPAEGGEVFRQGICRLAQLAGCACHGLEALGDLPHGSSGLLHVLLVFVGHGRQRGD